MISKLAKQRSVATFRLCHQDVEQAHDFASEEPFTFLEDCDKTSHHTFIPSLSVLVFWAHVEGHRN
jgi:hypothetical protein